MIRELETQTILKPTDDVSNTSSSYHLPPRRSKKLRNICLSLTAGAAVTLVVIATLALTVFKPKDPEITVNSIVLKNLQTNIFALNGAAVVLNVTLDVTVTVKNPNKVGMKYTSSTASLIYRGDLVGQIPIGAGDISGDEAKTMDVELTVMADRFMGKVVEIGQDVIAGRIPFVIYARVSGKVTILGVFKIHVVSSSTCEFDVDIGNKSAGDQKCIQQHLISGETVMKSSWRNDDRGCRFYVKQ